MDFLRLLEGIRHPILDAFFQFVTYFGQELVIIAIVCALYWCYDKRFAYQLGFTYFAAGLCVQTLKIAFRIPRPWVLDPSFHPVESAVPHATGYSFPSGHTQGGTSLFAPIALNAKNKLIRVLCVLAFVLIGFSRMYLGVHTPKDVLVSMGISLLFSWLIWRFSDKLLDSNIHCKKISAILIAVSLLVCIYASLLLHQEVIEVKYAADACKAAGAGLGFAIGWYLEQTKFHFETKTKTCWGQVAKLLIGLFIALIIKEGSKPLVAGSIYLKMLQYFVLVLWVLLLYPYCFSKFQKSALQK